MHVAATAPFVLLLLAIALLPVLRKHWWESNLHKALVSLLFALPTAGYLAALGNSGWHLLGEGLLEYLFFLLLLGSLYTIAGGIRLHGDLRPGPVKNTGLLALGAVLANLIGTTGASMLLIRPMLRMNEKRPHRTHVVIFFIFVVSNLGGLLTPLGDPPLYLGFLKGVPFFWTLQLWPQWLLVNGLVLAVFLLWDMRAFHAEPHPDVSALREPLAVEGVINLPFLAGVVGAVLLQPVIPSLSAGLLLLLGLLSLALTPARVRQGNQYTWGPMVEVAVIFAGLFVTMIPALEILRNMTGGPLQQPWHYFWATGLLSAFLDNAPTYLCFAFLAAEPGSPSLGPLSQELNLLLQAISCGAVFMGALTYVGNGPNFLVKSIAESAGYEMPSFFVYLLYSGLILLPIFGLVTLLFFSPGML
jgi:Na+/H+ antiporter NhaD/arsenite permease-like protein